MWYSRTEEQGCREVVELIADEPSEVCEYATLSSAIILRIRGWGDTSFTRDLGVGTCDDIIECQ
jgi:hypothetical protein